MIHCYQLTHQQQCMSKKGGRGRDTADNLGDILESGAWEATTFAFHADGTAVEVDKAAA